MYKMWQWEAENKGDQRRLILVSKLCAVYSTNIGNCKEKNNKVILR